MYWPDKIWGQVVKKKGIEGGNTTYLMKIFKGGFRRLCPSVCCL